MITSRNILLRPTSRNIAWARLHAKSPTCPRSWLLKEMGRISNPASALRRESSCSLSAFRPKQKSMISYPKSNSLFWSKFSALFWFLALWPWLCTWPGIWQKSTTKTISNQMITPYIWNLKNHKSKNLTGSSSRGTSRIYHEAHSLPNGLPISSKPWMQQSSSSQERRWQS